MGNIALNLDPAMTSINPLWTKDTIQADTASQMSAVNGDHYIAWDTSDTWSANTYCNYNGLTYFTGVPIASSQPAPDVNANWILQPSGFAQYEAGKTYVDTDVVAYNGHIYRANQAVALAEDPEGTPAKWTSTGLQAWDKDRAYGTGIYVFFEDATLTGIWKSILTTSAGESPSTAPTKWLVISDVGDMTLAGVQTVTGAKTFEDATLLLRNNADDGSLTFAHPDGVSTTITFPNTTGTLLTQVETQNLIEDLVDEAVAMAIIFGVK